MKRTWEMDALKSFELIKLAEMRERAKGDSQIEAFYNVLDNIAFDHMDQYLIGIRRFDSNDKRIFISVRRILISSTTRAPDTVSNSKNLHADASIDDFVKAVFVAVGQFEAHEFCESFKVYGAHAYFPHDGSGDVALPAPHSHYKAGTRANDIMLESWRDVAYRTDFQIAKRAVKVWFWNTAPMRTAVDVAEVITDLRDGILEMVRLALVTAYTLPSFVRMVIQDRTAKNSIDSQNSSKDKAA